VENEVPQRLPVTWNLAVRIWWGILWRCLLFVALPSLLFSSIVAAIVAFLFVPFLAGAVLKTLFVMSFAALSLPLCRWMLEYGFDGLSIDVVPAREEPRLESSEQSP
jgi:hypothetical protein